MGVPIKYAVEPARAGIYIDFDANGELRIWGRNADGSLADTPAFQFRDHGQGIECMRGEYAGPLFKLANDGRPHVVGLTTPA